MRKPTYDEVVQALIAMVDCFDLTDSTGHKDYATWLAARSTARRALNLPVRQLCVDGLEAAHPEASFTGDGQFPPFAIFDIDAQDNLQPYYLTRRQAEMAMERILKESS